MRSLTNILSQVDRRCWGLFVLALLLRSAAVALHAHQGWQLQYDPGMYLTLARNLGHGVYSMFHPLAIPDTIKMPGYPVLLWLLNANVGAVLMLQVLLSSLKVPLVFLLARRTGLGTGTALLAAALMALEPVDILLSAQLLSETLFTLLLLCGMVFLPRIRNWPSMLATALFLAAAAWVRPNGAWLIVVAGFLAFAILRQGLWHSVTLVGMGLFLLLPWAYRNQQALGRPYLNDSGAVAAAYYQVPEVLAAVGEADLEQRQKDLSAKAWATDWEDPKQFHAFFDGLRAEVRHTLLAYPFTWVRVQLQRALRILVAPGRGHAKLIFGDAPALGEAFPAISGLFSLAIVVASGLWLLYFRQLPSALRAILLMAAAIIISGSLSTSDARFKNPAMPMLLVGVAGAAGRAASGMNDLKAMSTKT